MKIILSRKGFDSENGGYPSPILPDGRMLSLPIPQEKGGIKYSEIYVDSERTYYTLMSGFGNAIKEKDNLKELTPDTTCHLDPDIYRDSKSREDEWMPLFGQKGASETHLRKNNVKEGDIFLFFGTFQHTYEKEGTLILDKCELPKHTIFGYLQIGKKYDVKKGKLEKWMLEHPHAKLEDEINSIYVASKQFSLDESLPGAGVFRFSNDLVLTKPNCKSLSIWLLPRCFNKKTKISYHNESNWDRGYFKSVSKGQEFVIEADDEIIDWVKGIISRHVII